MTASSRASSRSPLPVHALRLLIGCWVKEVIFSNISNKAVNTLISLDHCTQQAEWMTGREGEGQRGGRGEGGAWKGGGKAWRERGERAEGIC